MNRINIQRALTILCCLALTYINFSCTKDYIDPSRALDDDALSSPQGLTTISIGLQRRYSFERTSNIYNYVTANGFVTNELLLRNEGNIPELQLSTGGATVDGTNTVLAGLWTSSNKIIYDANLVIANAKNLSDKNLASGLIAYATISKALSMGNLSMYWEKVPVGIGRNIPFIDRMDGYKEAIKSIDSALNYTATDEISNAFLINLPDSSINILNTLNALKARYSLYVGDYENALIAANAVDLTKKSMFAYDNVSSNPIYTFATSTNNVFQPKDVNLGLPQGLYPEMADKRVLFYIQNDNPIPPAVRIKGFAFTPTSRIPVYLPGEMLLIKAEAYARTSRYDLALVELNKVITKMPGQDIFGVGADLPALTSISNEELLTQIYRNRCIELFMSGLKLEDMRRFNRPQNEMKRNFFPYPFVERDNNTNTPSDPVF
ncbi:RagB/SusD family nutrient uptake outer membrane protein [Olivibacter domesticus]|uniref:SusD family protein n=1 Tax=Olivibacter domesticus TaxID=407022 RepID=A0A1H7HK17_OLID1|nr:RagB/SusD family nutrient uptake outer membrane protein [Olivibacter domesticus]SEK50644.1 SusD family protein [Olivibacter domesticus]